MTSCHTVSCLLPGQPGQISGCIPASCFSFNCASNSSQCSKATRFLSGLPQQQLQCQHRRLLVQTASLAQRLGGSRCFQRRASAHSTRRKRHLPHTARAAAGSSSEQSSSDARFPPKYDINIPLQASDLTDGTSPSVEDTVHELATGQLLALTDVLTDALNEATPPYTAEQQRKRLWFAAIKPPMYSVAFVPILVGAAAAYAQTGVALAARCLQLTLGSICIIAWLNLSNDAFDAETGVDGDKPESVVNLTGNRTGVLLLANLFLAVGLATLAYAISSVGDPRIGYMLGAAICMGYVYQGPPFRLSYKGLGEPLCFFAFGPLATSAFYLAMLPRVAGYPIQPVVPALVQTLSVLVGITTSVILFCSHFHQIDGDTAAGKRSPLVRLGSQGGLKVLRSAVIALYVLAAAGSAAGLLPWTVPAAMVVSLPKARSLLDFAEAHLHVPALIKPLKQYAVKWHCMAGIAIVVGLLAPRWFPQLPGLHWAGV